MSDPSNVAMDWDTYWRGSADGTSFSSDGVDHPLVRDFWSDTFESVKTAYDKPRLLDVASGSGAVVDIARGVLGENNFEASCLDSSEWAIKSLVERFPFVEGVIGSASDMLFPDDSFDLATSQFGVEYAGLDAVNEMARVLAPGGTLVLLMHLKGGLIDAECAGNINAINDLQALGFIDTARNLFSEGGRAVRGETNGSRTDYDAAVQAMIPVSRQCEELLQKHGEDAAGGTLATLYRETDRIYGRIMHHDLDEVLRWLDRMSDELIAYKGRMQSMCDAANAEPKFAELAENLASQGFDVSTSEALRDEGGQAVAWRLVARRQAN
jgi:SAM-dependent methyltransferase